MAPTVHAVILNITSLDSMIDSPQLLEMSNAPAAAAADVPTTSELAAPNASVGGGTALAPASAGAPCLTIRNRDSVIVLDSQAAAQTTPHNATPLFACRDSSPHARLQGTYHMHQIGSNCPLNLCCPPPLSPSYIPPPCSTSPARLCVEQHSACAGADAIAATACLKPKPDDIAATACA
jgi:hypothetical protein